jgi:hypothetical protein
MSVHVRLRLSNLSDYPPRPHFPQAFYADWQQRNNARGLTSRLRPPLAAELEQIPVDFTHSLHA